MDKCYHSEFDVSNNTSKQVLCDINIPTDIVLIGAGIMSATLGIFLKILEPKFTIKIYEKLAKGAQESSNVWNNAGTGHAAFCELNYTKEKEDGSIDIDKAIEISESFEISRQFWAYLVKQKILNNPKSFINNIPHMSIVWGKKNINFLQNRFQKLQNSILFKGMYYSEKHQKINEWAPLIINGRNPNQKIAATYMKTGTDVNFEEITQQILNKLQGYNNVKIYYKNKITKIKKDNNDTWTLSTSNNKHKKIHARYIFIGAGGASLKLLQTTGIKKINKYAGFPVGGQFLVTNNQTIVHKHLAKVYTQSPTNTPPMSAPHMDTRIINGEKMLLFGPFATFNSKFLKYGSWLDLFYSLNRYNLLPLLEAGYDNFKLIKYLINQLMMTKKDKINALKEFYPKAELKDWKLIQAGQRVQIIKKNKNKRASLQFGTELISSSDNTLIALLGASPGASTAASISLEIINKMFQQSTNTTSWNNKLKIIIPSYNQKLDGNEILTNEIRQYVCSILELTNIKINLNDSK
ncbi:malate dehydrogenase (quinone) [Blochmannia endosymbiont of Colobopsis nipponica]|uniref:malate dehydrogenase (quinone) n=1 Tax=Blochmannia endosymbiont of Colobopsis nipponica TaxID=2681987 RepID=UPI00177FA973|nr:malate dehydrogenase (quinone) [Blochmannia endosymbiont of Colobopsis nipponica]QOI10944.1 malate dehydrogenase (quinone) [Blochmannia endosymbiont of Colobopsis nipponica]